jgi:hypothetical protein
MWRGHSYPYLNCSHCGSRAAIDFYRDKNGELIRDENGNPQWIWVGWGWKPNGK